MSEVDSNTISSTRFRTSRFPGTIAPTVDAATSYVFPAGSVANAQQTKSLSNPAAEPGRLSCPEPASLPLGSCA